MDGTKMSKSKGNLIAPEKYFDSVGADALRIFHLFVGPPGDDFDWSDQTETVIEGCRHFLDRVWRLANSEAEGTPGTGREPSPADLEIVKATNKLVDRVTHEFERWSYNTAVAAMREHTNVLYRYIQAPEGAQADTLAESIDTLLMLLAPCAPHMTAELWERRRGLGARVHAQRWPVAEPDLMTEDNVVLVVQVNGKLRDKVDVPASAGEEEVVAAALASPKVAAVLAGRQPARVIARPPALVNIVV
jgi:leucyl-tRNA synthetase